jgi:hypothetical protein
MRKALKNQHSKIIVDQLRYIPKNSTNNKKIEEILLKEQKCFCAYTDEYISRTDARDIEHFNPGLKGTTEDNYSNWFLVKSQWNKEKSNKWENLQPVLHPTTDDFEERIVYLNGDYLAKSKLDIEADNLVKLLKLDDLGLADKRKKYIKRKKEDMAAYGQDVSAFFTTLINDDTCQISYIRAIKEEFGFDIWRFLE